MKKILFLLLVLSFTTSHYTIAQYAVCTPVSCPDPENNGELNPDSLTAGMIGVPYNYVLSILPPPSGSGFTVNKIKIMQIDNMPAGFTWETNSNNSNDYLYNGNWYCVVIDGTPTGPAGVYEMTIWANAWIQTFLGEIPAPGNPQNGGTLQAVVCNPLNVNIGNDTIITTTQTLNLSAAHPAYASYLWSTGATTAGITVDGALLAPGQYTYTVTVSDSTGTRNGTHWPYCTKTDTIIVTVTLATEIAETPDAGFEIYPNPVNNMLCIEQKHPAAGNECIMHLCDLAGRIVITKQLSEAKTILDLSDIENGIYMVRIINGNHVSVKKIIVQ